jgi:hypothetical protein
MRLPLNGAQRAVLLVFLLALLWLAFVHPEQLAAFLAGLSSGLALAGWALLLPLARPLRVNAKDAEGGGGQGARIPITTEDPNYLERKRAVTVKAFDHAGIPVPESARIPIPPGPEGHDLHRRAFIDLAASFNRASAAQFRQALIRERRAGLN